MHLDRDNLADPRRLIDSERGGVILRRLLSIVLSYRPPLLDIGPPSARWQSGYAAACKAVYVGSIPSLASIRAFQVIPQTPLTLLETL